MSRTTLDVQELLRDACADGLRLWADGDKLIVQGAPAARGRWRPALAAAKLEILAVLAQTADDPVAGSASRPGCGYTSAFGNCTEPVAAGLAERFMLVKHPDGEHGCGSFAHDPLAIELRLAELLALGAIDAADADLCRRRYSTDSATWDLLLSACELAASRRPR